MVSLERDLDDEIAPAWLTTQQALVAPLQAMSTGAEGNIRSVLSRTCASERFGGTSKLIPRFHVECLGAELLIGRRVEHQTAGSAHSR
jgi:hypothetical protein